MHVPRPYLTADSAFLGSIVVDRLSLRQVAIIRQSEVSMVLPFLERCAEFTLFSACFALNEAKLKYSLCIIDWSSYNDWVVACNPDPPF